jgi:NAD(P)H-dependent FMN reductase
MAPGRSADRRFADHIAGRVQREIALRDDLLSEVIDIRKVALPYYDLPVPPAMAHRQYTNDAERILGERLDAADGYVIITNEFNHGYSARWSITCSGGSVHSRGRDRV